MPRTAITLLVCGLLGCLLLSARIITRSGGDPVSRTAVVTPVSETAELEPGSAVAEVEPGSDDDAAGQEGPILLPLNPPYLNKPIENDTSAPAIEPASEESAQVQEKPEETTPDEGGGEQEAARQPAQEEQAAKAALETPDEETPEERASDEGAPGEQSLAEGTSDEGTPDQQTPETTRTETPALPEPEPKRELTPAMAALRDRVRRTLAFHHRQPLSTRENTTTELMHACLAFGCNTQVYRGSSRQKANGITCLCWNYPCAGYVPLTLSEGRIAARIGYGLQERPSQLLAVLALSRVQATYPVRVGEEIRTVADLVEYEKLSCRSGTELSLKLIGLTYYLVPKLQLGNEARLQLGNEIKLQLGNEAKLQLGNEAKFQLGNEGKLQLGNEVKEPSWKNSLGEEWSIERIVKEELAQPIVAAPDGGMHRLMGLSYALNRRAKRKQPIEGQFLRAKKFMDQFHEHAFSVQNNDGSWGPWLLTAKGTSRDQATQLRSTGHVLEWLATSLPEDRLDDPRVVRSVEYVNSLLGRGRYRYNVKSYGTREIGSVMHALHALSVYDERFFKPADPEKPAPEPTRQAAG